MMADVPRDPDSGAAGTEIRTAEALRELGHEVETVWADDLGRRIRHGNLHYLLELPFAYRRAMLARLGDGRWDVVHANQPHGWLAARALVRTRKEIRPVFVHRSHGFEMRVERDLAPWRERYAGGRAAGPLRRLARAVMARLLVDGSGRRIARWADGHVVSASQCRDFLSAELGVPPARVALIPQAPPESYRSDPAPPLDPDRLRRVLYVGQVAFYKAPMILARTIARLAAERPELEFTWVCGEERHAEALDLLPAGVRSRVTLLGWRSQEALRDVYDRHGVFLFPSFFEGFGKTFLEAMSRGLCVVAADNGGMRDVIRDGRDGRLVETGDAEAMVEASLDLLDHPDRARALGEAARERALEYSWRRVASETAAFYRKLLPTEAAVGAV